MRKLYICLTIFFIFKIGIIGNENSFINAPIISASLFKNGLAFITRKITIPKNSSEILVKENLNPIHGTFWANYGEKVDFTFLEIETIQKNEENELSFEKLFKKIIGEKVKLFFNDKDFVVGKILKTKIKPDNYIVIDTEKGIEFIKINKIWRFQLENKKISFNNYIKKKEKIIKLKFHEPVKKQELTFSYLTKGLTWAPSYKLNLSNKKDALLSFKAVIKNELKNMKDADFYLISGFPAILFEKTISLLSSNTNINKFFNELSKKNNFYSSNKSILTQNVALNYLSPLQHNQANFDNSDLSKNDFDFHFQNIGHINIEKNQSKLINLGCEKIKTQKVIEWTIPNNRQINGHYMSKYELNANPDKYNEQIWDVIIFKNPFKFPMTTAPISIFKNEQIYSQNICYWTAPSQKATIKFSKTLNIKTKHSEKEIEGKRKKVFVLKNDYQKTQIEGEILVQNLRNKKEKIIIKRFFSGKLLEAQLNPEKTLLPEGIYSINQKNKLLWEFELNPGEEKIITYKYEILIDI